MKDGDDLSRSMISQMSRQLYLSVGVNDRIPVAQAGMETNSIRLISVRGVRLRVFAPSEEFGNPKRRVQARFQFAGSEYAFWITDPQIRKTYLAKTNGEYQLGDCFLTVSLDEEYDGYCYKLVAAVFTTGDVQHG